MYILKPINLLSSELLNEIFQLLPQEDKVECMLVCKFWKTTINELSLFQTIRISTPNNLDIITKKLQQEPENRFRVEHLIIDISYEELVQLDLLLSILPNLRTFHSPNYKNHPKKEKNQNSITDCHYSWQKTIEFITEYSDVPIICQQLLNLGICPNLRVLTTNDYDENIVPLLRCAPSLRKLSLGSRFINLNYIETIHQHVPLLESLKLKPLCLHYSKEFDSGINPATTMTQFSLEILDSIDTNTKISLFNYIIKKYPNLTTFDFTNHDVYTISEKDTENLCIFGWKPFLKSLPRLRGIYADHTIVPGNILDLLNDAGSQLNRLYIKNSILNNRRQTSQVHYSLQRLELDVANCSTFDWLKEFKQLHKLKLVNGIYDESQTTIQLNNFFKACPPSLKSISFKYTTISFEPLLSSNAYHPLSITKLSFQDVTLPENTDAFLSKHLSYLSKLKLKRCDLVKKTIDLPDCDIYCFQIQDNFNDVDRRILVKTNNKQRCFTTAYVESRYDNFKEYNGIQVQHQAVKSWIVKEEQEEEDTPFFVLTCRSLNNVVIRDTLNC